MQPIRLLAALPLLIAGFAQDQSHAWPDDNNIKLICPYSAGGSVDFI